MTRSPGNVRGFFLFLQERDYVRLGESAAHPLWVRWVLLINVPFGKRLECSVGRVASGPLLAPGCYRQDNRWQSQKTEHHLALWTPNAGPRNPRRVVYGFLFGPPGTQLLWRDIQRLETAAEMCAIMSGRGDGSP